MFVFACAGCGAELTAPLTRVALPVHTRQHYGNGVRLPVLMEPGTFAVDPDPWGGPWRKWDEIDPAEAEARGIHAPVHALSDGAPGASVVAPGDLRGTRLMPEKNGGGCCGFDGRDGPNTACETCGLPVAIRVDDCSLWQAVRLSPDAVRRVPVGVPAAPLSWSELVETGEATPPFEPIATWGERQPSSRGGWWSPLWEAAAARALAHLLVASQGRPVELPTGLMTDVFQRALDTLLPAGPPEWRAVLAGPGRPSPDGDILFVPVHPSTGRTWTPAGRATSAYLVPLPLGVWLWAVSSRPPPAVRVRRDVLRDHPVPRLPAAPFRLDRATFLHTLVRLPAVRRPWLRGIVEEVTRGGWAHLF